MLEQLKNYVNTTWTWIQQKKSYIAAVSLGVLVSLGFLNKEAIQEKIAILDKAISQSVEKPTDQYLDESLDREPNRSFLDTADSIQAVLAEEESVIEEIVGSGNDGGTVLDNLEDGAEDYPDPQPILDPVTSDEVNKKGIIECNKLVPKFDVDTGNISHYVCEGNPPSKE